MRLQCIATTNAMSSRAARDPISSNPWTPAFQIFIPYAPCGISNFVLVAVKLNCYFYTIVLVLSRNIEDVGELLVAEYTSGFRVIFVGLLKQVSN